MKRKNKILMCVFAVVVSVSMIFANVLVHAENLTDQNTLTRWTESTANNTKNMGRIWTDKTVSTEESVALQATDNTTNQPITMEKGDSDFLVGLSALGSSGKVLGEVRYSLPLDIVLILDNTKTSGELSANDPTNPNATRWDILKTATKSFIDKTQEMNAGLSEGETPHRIAIITTAANGRIVTNNFENCNTEAESESIKSKIDGIKTGASFSADKGLDLAQGLFGNTTRVDSMPVILYFATGQHSGGNELGENVLNKGITLAKDLKNTNNARIFTIATFGEGDATTPPKPAGQANNFDLFMHGISSNYLKPTAYNSLGDLNLREDGSNPSYYKTAKDSVELESIFEQIIQDVVEVEAIPPTDSEENQGSVTAITFHDELGDYMKFDGLKGISFANNKFTAYDEESSTTDEGKTTTVYRYRDTQGQVNINPIYPDGNVADIKITVESWDNLAKGDKLTVEIPANMIPLKYYEVDTREASESMTINETYPLRIFYGASLKDGVEDKLARPDGDMTDYIKKNTDNNGEVKFFSNKYYGENSDNTGVYVEFNPNKENDFYYFQVNQPLYTNEACTNLATGNLDQNGTYYYKRVYYEEVGGKPVAKDNVVKLDGNSLLITQGYAVRETDGTWYIPKGTPRLTTLNNYFTLKKVNNTGTAPYIVSPGWVNAAEHPTTVNVKLGNNGYLTRDIPGSLSVTKKVTADEGLAAPDKTFEFQLQLTDTEDANKTYTAQIFNKDNSTSGAEFQIAQNDTFNLKDGQRIEVYGLEAGVNYTVTETNVDGFTTTKTNDSGAITSNVKSEAVFTNNYSVAPIEKTSEELGVNGIKTLTGRDFKAGDEFKFYIANSANATSPYQKLPDPAECIIKPTSGNTADISFGKFTFEKPGRYIYAIRERLPQAGGTEIIPGITYDVSAYRLTVDVKDNGDGTLAIANIKIEKTTRVEEDLGSTLWETLYDGATLPTDQYANFTNVYKIGEQTITLTGTKELTNKKLADYGERDHQFEFLFEAAGKKDGNDYVADAAQPMPAGSTEGKYTFHNTVMGGIVIPNITFTSDHDGNEYLYKLTEMQPTVDGTLNGAPLDGAYKVNTTTGEQTDAEVTDKGDVKWVYKGITFENHVHEIKVKVDVLTDENNQLIVKTSVMHDGVDSGDDGANQNFIFKNIYNASTALELEGTKNLTGRNFVKGDEFTFNITPVNNAPAPVDADGNAVTQITIKPTNGTEYAFDFGKLNFDITDMVGATEIPSSDPQVGPSYEKIFSYKLSEVKGNAGGMSYVPDERIIQIKLTDDGIGTMTAEIVSDPNNQIWNNTYTANTPVYGGLDITKVLNGRNMAANEFTFTVQPIEGTPGEAFTVHNGSAADGMTNTIKVLNNLKFTQADSGKTFKYQITENSGDLGGVNYDKSTYVVAISVIDNYNGTLSYNTVITKDGKEIFNGPGENVTTPIAFVNAYTSAPVQVSGNDYLTVTKVLEGRDWFDTDEFTFTITRTDKGDQDDVTMADPTEITIKDSDDVANNAESKAFGNITFNKVGNYTFEVKEKKENIPGIVYDSSTKTISVRVTDDGSGQLKAEVTGGSDQNDNLTFKNLYRVEIADITNLTVKKNLEGREWMEGDSFTFNIEADLTDEATKKAYEAGRIALVHPTTVTITNETADYTETFGHIHIGVPGTFKFIVSEVVPADEDKISGITYAKDPKPLTIKVKDNGEGRLIPTVQETLPLEFTNNYEADSVDVDTDKYGAEAKGLFTKKLIGRDSKSGEAFNFSLAAVTKDAPMPIKATKSVKDLNNGVAKDFGFGTITFDKVGTYEYNVVEENAGKTIDGLTYASNTAKLTVKVTDDTNGKLVATASVANPTFENVYKAAIDFGKIGAKFSITKSLSGRDMTKDQFSFEIKAKDEASSKVFEIPVAGKTVKSPAANMDAKAVVSTIENIKFTEADSNKTYGFTVDEIGTAKAGYTYDETKYDVNIKVADLANGKLEATVEVSDGNNTTTHVFTPDTAALKGPIELAFNNTYNANSNNKPVSVKATKTLNGRNLKANEFNFAIKDAKGAVVAKGTNEANGNINFEKTFTYNIEQLNKMVVDGLATKSVVDNKNVFTIKYIAEEVGNMPAGVTMTAGNFSFNIKVTDNGDGALATEVVYPNGGISFVNTYTVGADNIPLAINGSKVLKADEGLVSPSIDGKFTFTMTAREKDAPLPENISVTNDETGNIQFGKMVFKVDMLKDVTPNADGSRNRVFNYTVTESGQVAGITNDKSSTRNFTVELKNDGKGNLSVTPSNEAMFKFTNTYAIKSPNTSSVTDQIKITKKLTGRDMLAGEFKFELVDKDNKVVSTGTNDAKGNIVFKAIAYNKPGNFTYTIREVQGNKGGVGYDATSFTINTTVTDNSDGTLSVRHETNAKEVVFNNTYKAHKTSIIIGAAKKLVNKDLEANQFEFKLMDENGKVIDTSENDDKGQIIFDAIEFDKTGTYKYQVAEVKGHDKNIKYDENVYTVTVKVTDNKEGNLVANATMDDENGIVFVNTYEIKEKPTQPSQPDKPNKDKPNDSSTQTGDSNSIGLLVGLMALATGGIFLFRRKEK